MAQYKAFSLYLDSPTAMSLVRTSSLTPNELIKVTLIIQQDGIGGRNINWNGGNLSIRWMLGNAPGLGATPPLKYDIIELWTVDGGVTWFGVPISRST